MRFLLYFTIDCEPVPSRREAQTGNWGAEGGSEPIERGQALFFVRSGRIRRHFKRIRPLHSQYYALAGWRARSRHYRRAAAGLLRQNNEPANYTDDTSAQWYDDQLLVSPKEGTATA